MRRPQPSHPPAFLVDQDRRVARPIAPRSAATSSRDLVGRAAVAAEQDETDRVGSAEEAPLVVAQLFTGTTQDDRTRCRYRSPAYQDDSCSRNGGTSV